MQQSEILRYSVAFLAALLAGSINSVAGGGTLISFPALVWLGVASKIANATSTLGIWPGSLGSIWGFRRELGRTDKKMRLLLIPGAFGGAAGAVLLRMTPTSTFDKLIPFLVLFATVLFCVQTPIQNWLKTSRESTRQGAGYMVFGIVLMLLVGLYGGYFGAGISIMMLSVLGILGMTDILEMNALTSLFSLCINGVAIAFFVAGGLIDWSLVPFMAVGAVIGGYGAAGIARRIGRPMVRRFVITVGFSIAAVMLWRSVR